MALKLHTMIHFVFLCYVGVSCQKMVQDASCMAACSNVKTDENKENRKT